MTAEKKPTDEELFFQVEKLTLELNTLKRLIFGQKRERFVPEPQDNQLSLLVMHAVSSPAVKEQISYIRRKPQKKQKKHPLRQSIPAHIPRHDIVVKPDEDVSGMKKIGEEVTEELEIERNGCLD